MVTDYIIDGSDPQATMVSDGSKGDNIKGHIQIYSTENAPTYEFTYWSGRLINDLEGNVYPVLVRSYATIGSEGVKWSSVPDKNGNRQLDLTDFLLIRQSEGKIRVDSLIGLLPSEADTSHEAYVEFAQKLCDIDILRKIKQMGCKITSPFKFKLTKALLLKRSKAINAIEKKDFEEAIKKAEKQYQKWATIFDKLNTEGE